MRKIILVNEYIILVRYEYDMCLECIAMETFFDVCAHKILIVINHVCASLIHIYLADPEWVRQVVFLVKCNINNLHVYT